jgi:hypothetical protein
MPHRPCHCLWRAFEWGILSLLLASVQVSAQTASSTAVQVRTPEEFQQQVRLGTPHIVITEHLNMSDTPAVKEARYMNDGMISIQKTMETVTQTIRVRSQPHDMQILYLCFLLRLKPLGDALGKLLR